MPKKPSSRVTILDLARKLKLSQGAVSQALNGTESTIRVSERTRERVKKLANKLGYRPNQAARILRTGRSGMVGILLHQGFSSLIPVHMYYARQNAERVGLFPFIYEISSRKEDAAERALEFVLDAKVDALMVLAWLGDQSLLQSAGIPVALIGRQKKQLVPGYSVDQTNGYRMAAEHLIQQGCRTLSVVSADSSLSSPPARGTELAVQAAQKQGKSVSWRNHVEKVDYEGFVATSAPQMHGIYAFGYLAIQSMIAQGNLPDGILFQSDNMAVGALRACAEVGIRVPDDLAISGFGDHPECPVTVPSLTSVIQPLEQMQRAAFDDLQAALNGQKIPQDKLAVFPCELIVRESSLRTSR
jgi:LacI family transcriptional regulator